MRFPFRRRRSDEVEPEKELPPGIPTISKETILPYLAGALLVLAFFGVCIVYRSYTWPAFLAMLLYAGFEPLNIRLAVFFRGNRTMAAGVSTLFVVLLVLGPAVLLVIRLVFEGIDLLRLIRDLLTGERVILATQSVPFVVDLFTGESFFWVDLPATVQSLAGDYGSYLDPDRIGSWVGNAYNFVFSGMTFALGLAINLLLGLLLLFFLFRDGPGFYVFLAEALPFPREITARFADRMKELMSAVLRGNVFVAILQGAAVGGALFISDIPNAVLWGSVAGVFSLIPVVGTAVIWLPAALYLALARDSYSYAVFMAIIGPAAYLLLENVFKPLLLDRKLGMHPVFLFLAILGGIAEFGISGVVLGPLIVTIFLTMWRIYHIWDSERYPDASPPGEAR